MGRCTCTLAHWLIPTTLTAQPGIYALVGAAAMMAGTCRVHVSLVVIMLLGDAQAVRVDPRHLLGHPHPLNIQKTRGTYVNVSYHLRVGGGWGGDNVS